MQFVLPSYKNDEDGGGRLWESRSDFQGAVGAVWASTAPTASTASVVGGARALAEAVALTGHLHDGGVCQEAIENGGRGRYVAKEDAPILRRSICRNQR
jgi:hypothetical protein